MDRRTFLAAAPFAPAAVLAATEPHMLIRWGAVVPAALWAGDKRFSPTRTRPVGK